MFTKFKLVFLVFLVTVSGINGDWVEIPQFANRKSFVPVTPYNPYIYQPSLVFTSSPTVSYEETLSPPLIMHSVNNLHMKYTEPKKSITKMPDFVVRKTLTTPATTFPKTTRSFFLGGGGNITRHKPHHHNNNKKEKFKNTYHHTSHHHAPIEEASRDPRPSSSSLNGEDDDEYEWVYDDDSDDRPNGSDGDLEDDDDTESGADHPTVAEYDEYYDDDEPADSSTDPVDDTEHEVEYYDEEYDESLPENDEDRDEGNSHEKHVKEKGSSQGYNYFGILPFLQRIQDTLLFRNSNGKQPKEDTYEGKVSFLEDLKNRLLYTIKSKMSKLWPGRSKRVTRSARGEHWYPETKGHDIGFASNEAALLTLGFLTFAVFLIKSILKLIHALKGKHHHGYKKVIKIPIMINQTMVPTVPTTVATFQFKRDQKNLDHVAHIMSRIEDFNKYNHNN